MGDRVNKHEIRKANDVHILDYLDAKGEPYIDEGNYVRLEKHDSMVINKNGKWNWNSRGFGGYGAISFARYYFHDGDFVKAVRDVNGMNIERTYSKEDVSKQRSEKFVYPYKYENNTHDNIIDYLHNKRGISKDTINHFIKIGLVAEDKKKNCVFKWKDRTTNKIVGADRQGTIEMDNGKYFKQIIANSKHDGGFQFDVGTPTSLTIFESPIDAISYYELYKPKNMRFKSMSGLKDQTIATSIVELGRELEESGNNEGLKTVYIAVDNDDAGHTFSKKWNKMITDVERVLPNGKDWNEDLQKNNYQSQELQRVKINNAIEMER